MKPRIFFLILIIAMTAVFFGCLPRQQTGGKQQPSALSSVEGENNTVVEDPNEVATTTEEDVVPKEKIKYLENGKIDTSDWKIYRNEEYGFELKYPNEWEREDVNKNRIVFRTNIVESAEAISFSSNSQKINFSTLKQQMIEKYKDVMDKPKKIIIDDNEALMIETSEFGTIIIFMMHNNIIFEITTGGRLIDYGVLDSFKFL